MEKKDAYVYIMSNRGKNNLYVSVVSDLKLRLKGHKNVGFRRSFSSKYNSNYCVYYKLLPSMEEAQSLELKMKAMDQDEKVALIESKNPEWADLWKEIKEW